MSSRTIEAPGIELREYDNSSYDQQKTDYSLTNTVALIHGFADEGKDYVTQWVNSKDTLESLYGQPKNEAEMYFYNAGIEILNKGGICLMSKLPYKNIAKDNFTYTEYSVQTSLQNITMTELSAIYRGYDDQIVEMLRINGDSSTPNLMSVDDLDNLRTGTSGNIKNKIRIIDVSRKKYDTLEVNCVSTEGWISSYTNDCLGIVPVIVSPVNAIYFQNYLDSQLSNSDISSYNVIEENGIQFQQNDAITYDIDVIQNNTSFDYASVRSKDYTTTYTSEDFNTTYPSESLTKDAVGLFPTIQITKDNSQKTHLDKQYLKQIGIVVVKLYKDSSNNNMINYQILESFVGSLDKTARDQVTNQSIYIDTIVNSNSKYINVFSNIDKKLLDKASIVGIQNQKVSSLGFNKLQLQKTISYTDSILDPLTRSFKTNEDRNRIQLDLVLDAGTSTIAQLTKGGIVDLSRINMFSEIEGTTLVLNSNDDAKYWNTVLRKYDEFCKNTRKDCMYLADGLRSFCVEGNEKIVRYTKTNSSNKKDILTKLKYLTGLNSNFSAGYCDWFLGVDSCTGDLLWIPPSIKAAGIYIYTDIYSHKWDAPAGLNRGVVKNIIDCAFSPTNDEAGKIYQQAWNYAVNYPLNGVVIEGQKTFQMKKTAFDRVNVRRLFLYLEKAVVRIARHFLYEGNTSYLRQRFVDQIKPVFDDAVNGYGISEYYIKCDDTNNTTQTIENNELHCQIAVKPVKTIEYIVLDFVCTNQSAVVNETVFNQ